MINMRKSTIFFTTAKMRKRFHVLLKWWKIFLPDSVIKRSRVCR